MLELNYKTFGEGFPVVILHGLFGTLDNWQTIARKLAEHYTVYIIDQRDHGRSPHTDIIDYPHLAFDLHAFLESNWIYKAHIIGHSMGGKTAMRFTLDYPDMVEKLIVIDIAPKTYSGGHEPIFDALLGLQLDAIESRQEAEAYLESRIPELGVRQFLLKNLTRNEDGDFTWKMNLPLIHQHYPDILAGIEADVPFEGPSWFIRGARSNYVTDADWPNITRLFPAAQLITIPDAGHWVHADQTERLLEAVEGALET